MAIKRYTADADNTITNAFEANLKTRGTDANMGESDIVEVFTIYGQTSQDGTSSSEQSKILLNFPTSDISADRTSGDIPGAGNVSFYLRVHNAPHGQTLPKNYDLTILPVSRSWDEGYGLDMESYSDKGSSNWLNATTNVTWSSPGGDYLSSPSYEQHIETGTEDVEVDITDMVEGWLTTPATSNGVGISLSSSYVDMDRSFYIKKFFSRGSEHFYLRPKIEARWTADIEDDRGSFYASSSLVPGIENLNTLYIYNRVRGELKNIPTDATNLTMSLYYGESTGPVGTVLTSSSVTNVSDGIYSSTVYLDTTSSYLYDVWHSDSIQYVTGSRISVRSFAAESTANTGEHVSNITNLKEKYSTSEKPRMRMFVRDKDWSPTIYTVATANIETKIIPEAFYSIHRVADGFNVIPYGTGSIEYTKMSYDKDGNYFDIDMSLFEEGYSYGIKVSYKNSGRLEEQPELFKFRVE